MNSGIVALTSEARPVGGAELIGYGLIGLPLAFVALPIYVHLPAVYAQAGLSLGMIGSVLLLARLADALIDPLIGWWGDHHASRRSLIAAAVPLLVAGYAGLFSPPATSASLWLLGMLLVVYSGYSLASVNHHALGAELARQPHQRTRLTAAREGFALLGVLLAAVLPGMLSSSLAEGLRQLSLVFAASLLMGIMLLWRLPSPLRKPVPVRGGLLRAIHNPAFRRLLAIFAFSGIAAAIPATLVLFFVSDVLRAQALSGVFLGVYFLSAALGLPFWVMLARRRGKAFAWRVGMLLAIACFAGVITLGPGQVLAFSLICALTGFALGADLALPASMLADLIETEQLGAGNAFGWWNFMAKLNLALAAGAALPLLEWLGYVPGAESAAGRLTLAWVYAGLPALLKCVAVLLLWRLADKES